MRGKKVWRTIPIIFVAAVTAFCFLYKPIYYRLYLGDRIQGEIQVTIDGKAAFFDEENTDAHLYYKGDFSAADHTARISLKAGEYGSYSFDIYVVGLNQPIQISVMQYNWWNVHTFCLDVAVDTHTNTALFTYTSTDIGEDGAVYMDAGSKEVDLTKEEYVKKEAADLSPFLFILYFAGCKKAPVLQS